MPLSEERKQQITQAYHKHAGNLCAIAREVGVNRNTIRFHLRKLGLYDKKPLFSGSAQGMREQPAKLPPVGMVKRYICTSAQNNTKVNEKVWENLLALKAHYDAELLVGTFSYNKGAYGRLAVKRNTLKAEDQTKDLWYDAPVKPYFSDQRRALAPDLVWSGEMNILPTAEDPLSGLETYNGTKSSIFPHAKMAMRSIAAMKGTKAKLNFSTGTVTNKNYIAKKAGLKGEHHHVYGAVLVEVNHKGEWWVRQLNADSKGTIQDLTTVASGGKISKGKVEAVVWGDFHATRLSEEATIAALGDSGMLAVLKPRYQFIHDVLEGVSINHHSARNPHALYRDHLRGYSSLAAELEITSLRLRAYNRAGMQMVVVDSNHDNWLGRWLREHDYRIDPLNAKIFLVLQLATYISLGEHDEAFNLTKVALHTCPRCPKDIRFLKQDESMKLCGSIEMGMHGHLGPDGARGTPNNLRFLGKAVTGHTHSAGIYDGLYVAGTSTELDMDYNSGPSSWTHSHVLVYPNGKRTIITLVGNQWRA